MATVDPDGTVTINETNAEGKSITWHYKPVEGQAVTVIGRDNTTVLVKKVNDHTNEQIWNSNGRTNRSKAVLSKDGKTTTFTMDGTDKDGKPSATGDIWPNRVHHWIPSLDHPSAKATVKFTISAPTKDLVIANGRLDQVQDSTNTTRTWTYTEGVPIPAYCMVIAVGVSVR